MNPPRTLLLVDDEENILRALNRVLRRDGYQILRANSGAEGLTLLAEHPEVGVILSDQRMPNMTGIDFLSRVREQHPDTVRMILSGYTDLKTVTDAINEGAVYKFLTKPWEDELLRANVEEAFSYGEQKRESKRRGSARSEENTKRHNQNPGNHNVNSSLKNGQFILLLVLGFFIAAFAAIWHVSHLQSQLIESTAIKNAHLFSDALTEFRTLYTSEVVATAKQHGLEITHDYTTKENAIPLPATLSMLLGEKLGKHTSGSKTMLYSPYPFPWRKDTGGLRDQFMQQAWEFLSQNPDKPYYRFSERDGRKTLRYATADVMRPACIQCHNQHPDTPKNDWKTGDLRGVLEVDFPLHQVITQTREDLKGTMAIFGAIALLGVIGIASVTSKLRRTSVDLQKRVQQRTEELSSKATALESINQELDQFAYVVSHDLKAPLRAIANLSEWIEEDIADDLSDDTRKKMTLLRGRVARMDNLINGILQYSRVGRIDDEIETVDVNELLQEIISGLAVPEDFVIDIAPGMPVFETARVPLSQVFANLLSNAIKYHHRPGQGHVNVDVRKMGTQETDDGFYEFSVHDNGPGIAPEYHEKVFAIFQTLNARDTVESTGVGLSIVKKIIEAQGGKIILESAEGEGSTFRFSVPKAGNKEQRGANDAR